MAVIILLIRSAAREGDPAHTLFPKPHQVIMKELGPIIRMQLFDRKGQPLEHLRKGAFHRQLPSSQEHHALTPPSGHIDQLQGIAILSRGALSSMMHQIGLEMAWIGRIPGNASHRYSFGHLIGSMWTFAR